MDVGNGSAKLRERLRYCFQQSDGPEKIFAGHMRKDGKYIVFCCGKVYSEEMVALSGMGRWIRIRRSTVRFMAVMGAYRRSEDSAPTEAANRSFSSASIC